MRCQAHRASKCQPCATRYRARIVRVAEAGANQTGLHGYLLTLTAPGTGPHQRWVPEWNGRSVRPDCGCAEAVGEGQEGLGAWNVGASRHWHDLHKSLSRLTPLQFFRAVEVQKRGALHFHVLVLARDPLDVREVQELALAAGFGCTLDLSALQPGAHARYVAKYVSKTADARLEVPWWADRCDPDTGELTEGWTRATFRAWSSSKSWPLTMRALTAAIRERMARERARQVGTDDQAAIVARGLESLASPPRDRPPAPL